MIDGGKRAGDKNLKARRKQKKAAAEHRIKVRKEVRGNWLQNTTILLDLDLRHHYVPVN